MLNKLTKIIPMAMFGWELIKKNTNTMCICVYSFISYNLYYVQDDLAATLDVWIK